MGLQTAAELCHNTAVVWVSAMTALCPVLHGQSFLQSLPLSYTDRDGSALPAGPLLHEAASKGCCFPLLPDSTLTSPLQRAEGLQRSSAQKRTILCWGASPLGMGKADSALVLLNFSVGSKACGNSGPSSFPSSIRLAGKLSEILLIACSESSIVSGMLQYLFFFLN